MFWGMLIIRALSLPAQFAVLPLDFNHLISVPDSTSACGWLQPVGFSSGRWLSQVGEQPCPVVSMGLPFNPGDFGSHLSSGTYASLCPCPASV